MADLEIAIKGLAATRPTAVNLFWALDRNARLSRVASGALPLDQLRARLLAEAQAIRDEDISANRAMGAHGASLVPPNARILTHCNAGALATAGYGTALGVVRAAHEQGKVALVWVDETRPGDARLAADGVGVRARRHSASADRRRGGGGPVMARGEVDLIVTGADRICRQR